MDRRQGTLADALERRILLLDGAMGTMIQSYELAEQDFRGERFAGHARDQRGNNDLLALTRPDVITAIHRAYFEAGADIAETNTFNSTAVSMADYGMESVVAELNYEAARLARKVADEFGDREPDKPRFVCGVLGPTNRTCSISPDVKQSGIPERHVRRAVSRLYGADRSATQGRSGHAHGRDGVRHTQLQGGALRSPECARGSTGQHPDPDIGHDYRCQRPDAVRSDDGSLLAFCPARGAAQRRSQLRPRRPPAASVCRGIVRHRQYPRELPSERGLTKRVWAI